MKLPMRNDHLRDEDLLLQAEGELPPAQRLRIDQHLEHCARCQTRQQQLCAVGDEITRLAVKPALPPATAARERLQTTFAQWADLQRKPAQATLASSWLEPMRRPVFWLRVGLVTAVLVTAITFQQASRPLQGLMGAYEETGPEPNHALTPGSAAPMTTAEVCSKTDGDLDPPVSAEKRSAVLRAYRMSEHTARAYQVDYLINPQLGGDSSLQNLWPEPYHATVWNASAKDALETRLHGMVCSGQVDLRTAQGELATDWIAAYKKYFHASRPVQTVASVRQEP